MKSIRNIYPTLQLLFLGAWLYRGYAVRCLLLTNYWWMYDRFNLNYKAWYMTYQKYNNDTDKKFCGTLARPVNNMAIVLLKYSFFIFEQFEWCYKVFNQVGFMVTCVILPLLWCRLPCVVIWMSHQWAVYSKSCRRLNEGLWRGPAWWGPTIGRARVWKEWGVIWQRQSFIDLDFFWHD